MRRQPTRLSHALRFLHKPYKPRYYYWMLMGEVQKLLLIGVALMVPKLQVRVYSSSSNSSPVIRSISMHVF